MRPLETSRLTAIGGQHCGTHRYVPTMLADEDELTHAVIALASEKGRYGYRRVTALLRVDGFGSTTLVRGTTAASPQ